MKSLRFLDRRAGYSLGAMGLLLGMVAPTLMPAFASADVLSARSISMSSATKSATGVSYDVKFTSPAGISGVTSGHEGGVVVEFCTESPLIDTTCTHPGMTTTGVGVTGVKYAGSAASGNGTVSSATDGIVIWKAGAALSAGATFEMTLTGITNPSSAGTFYARMATYDTDVASNYTSATDLGSYDDNGSVALSATENVGVTAYVLESMTFCVSKGDVGDTTSATAISTQAAPSENCGSGEADCTPPGVDAGCVVAPDLTLGEQSGTVIALDSSKLSTGGVYAQLSTNASSGAVVHMKSDATSCGGLYRNGNPANCDITPETTTATGFSAGAAKFGLTVGSGVAALTSAGAAGSGTGTLTTGTGYDATHYYIDYPGDNTTGATSTYGSEVFHSTAPVNNMNVPINFGASITNTTPAGAYGANFSMIATGTF